MIIINDIDENVQIPEGEAIIPIERLTKGDMRIEINCESCGGAGKISSEQCDYCYGTGRVRCQNPSPAQLSEIRYAQVQVRNILNYLWNVEIIDDAQHQNGCLFQIWRQIHQTAFGYHKPVSSGYPEDFGIRLRAHGYVLLMKRLDHMDQRAIIAAIETTATPFQSESAYRARIQYRALFGRLSSAMQPIKDQITYLENLSDIERQELSEERLKIFIAGIRNDV